MQKIEVNIAALSKSESSPGDYALVLEDEMGIRRLPVVIGHAEAQAIAMGMEKLQFKRPLTHDLLKNTIKSLDARVNEVVIAELKEGALDAFVHCTRSTGDFIEIRARASDAIALALRFDCPIFMDIEIFELAGVMVKDNRSNQKSGRLQRLENYSTEELERLLNKVLAKEDYESAAKIRDLMMRR